MNEGPAGETRDGTPPTEGKTSGRGETAEAGGLASLELDRVIHERARLKVLTYLSSAEKDEVGFTELRDGLGFSAGNLSVQLRKLEEAGYVKIGKRFVGDRPFTGVVLTMEGHKALAAYVEELELIVASLKAGGRN